MGMRDAGPARRRGVTAAAAALLIMVVAACTSTRAPSAGSADASASGGIRALWQGAPWTGLTLAGPMVLGISRTASPAQVSAVSAMTGAAAWTLSLPASLPEVLGLVPAGSVVVVEAGRGLDDPAGGSVVTEYVAVDLATGRQVWTAPVPVTGREGPDVFPPVAAAGNLLLTGDPAGTVTARVAATGKVAWRHPRPAACGPAPGGEFSRTALGIAADGPLAAVSFGCSRTVIVQRLDTATGRALWSWRSPAAARGAVAMSVTAAARDGGIVLITGAFGRPTAAEQGSARLPRPYAWPARLGPSDQASMVLALAADGGHPRWSETGGQQQTITLTDGAVCETTGSGLECRDDMTGAPTLPLLVTALGPQATPPDVSFGYDGISGGLAAFTTAPSGPVTVTVRAVRVRGGATAAEARIAIAPYSYAGTPPDMYTAAAGALPGGATLILLRPLNPPGPTTAPVMALRVTPRP